MCLRKDRHYCKQFLLHHQNIFFSANSPQTITEYKKRCKYTELHAKVNHEIRLPESFNVTVLLKCYNPGLHTSSAAGNFYFLDSVVPENRKQFLQSSRKFIKQLHFYTTYMNTQIRENA